MDDLILKLGTPPKKLCSYRKWFEGLTADEQEAVDKAMANPDWSSAALTKMFREHGAVFDRKTTADHRQGECRSCGSR